MTGEATVQLTQAAYRALLERNEELEDRLAAFEADDGSRIPHPVALAIIRGEAPITAFRAHHTLTLRELARRAGISPATSPKSNATSNPAPLPPSPRSPPPSTPPSTPC